jgi:hypothetical protein
MTTLSNGFAPKPSHRFANETDDVVFDNDLAFCFGLVVVATLLVILAMVANPAWVSLDLPPVGA